MRSHLSAIILVIMLAALPVLSIVEAAFDTTSLIEQFNEN